MPAPVPVLPDQGRGFRYWSIKEIYIGALGLPANRYVPNVDDAVWDWDTGLYRVVAVDSITHLSVLEPHSFTDLNGGILPDDIILSTGPNHVSESYRVYINTDVTPHTLAFDSRLYLRGSNAHHVKVFKGTDTSVSGHVISGVFNGSGVLTSENIPLELCVTPGVVNLTVKTPAVANVIEAVADGDVVTCVVYSSTGIVLSKFRMLATLSNFIRSTDISKRYIVGIELLSPYLSVTDSHLLEYPVNLTLQSGSVQGRVTYDDASTLTLPIDGTRFALLGVDRYIAARAGNTAELVLVYNLQPNEYAYGVSAPIPDRSIAQPYRVTAIQADGAYTVKLFVIPKWSSGLNRWVLDYLLYDLDRATLVDATPFIETVSNTPVFDGTLLDAWQHITVAVNLNSVDSGYLSYRYLQLFSIQLKAGATNTGATQYTLLAYKPDVILGSELHANSSPDLGNPIYKRLDISQGLSNVGDWLDRVYWPSMPLYATGLEAHAPEPTHVRVKLPASSWVRELTVAQAVEWLELITAPIHPGDLVRLEFIRRESTDLELAAMGINVRV